MADHRYEIDHHVTEFDALKIIGKSIDEYGMNLATEMGDDRDSQKWEKLGEYASFLY
jgi:hypothetical protein